MSPKNKPNEFSLTRIYDAPVKMVWDAWTNEKQAAKWWGPRGFTLTTHSKDFKAGGIWHYTMHGPDGVDYPNKTNYLEIEKYSRMVYDHGGNDEREPLFRVTVTFKDLNGKTKMDMCMACASAESAKEIKKFIKKASGESTWDRLAEYLGKETSGKEQFFINRSFNVSIEAMYQLWTDPNLISKWLPPTGATMEYITADIIVGGSAFWKMEGAHGTMYGRAKYLELTKPNRIVYTQQFVDKDEKVSRHPMAPTWPETMLTIITLTEEGPDQTRVTITWEAFGNVTREELETFVAAKSGMTQGWSGSFDKLEEFLTNH